MSAEVESAVLVPDRAGSPGKRRLAVLFVAVLFCFAYFPPRWADWNQNSRFDLVVAMVEGHTVRIDQYVANTGDYAEIGGHYYSDKAPGMALLGVPAYAAVRALLPVGVVDRLRASAELNPVLLGTTRADGQGLGTDRLLFFVGLTAVTLLTTALPSAALVVILALVLARLGLGPRASLVGAGLYALATCAFPYSNAFVGHQTAAVLLFAAFALALAPRPRATRLPAIGFLLGFAAITEYQSVLVGGPIALYVLRDRLSALTGRPVRRVATCLASLAAGALPPLILLGLYDLAAFGTALPVGYFHSTLWADVHQTGFLSLTYPQLEALWGITFGTHRGLFFLSPYLLLAVPGYARLLKASGERPAGAVLLLGPLFYLAFNASSAMWQGGFAVGPRYLVAALPFLAVAASFGLDSVWARARWRLVAVAMVAWSAFAIWTETIGGQAFPDYTANPLFDLSLPRLALGDIARNLGTAVGLVGWNSLVPPLLVVAGAAVVMLVPPRWADSRRALASRRT
jgi:hypothetical protein